MAGSLFMPLRLIYSGNVAAAGITRPSLQQRRLQRRKGNTIRLESCCSGTAPSDALVHHLHVRPDRHRLLLEERRSRKAAVGGAALQSLFLQSPSILPETLRARAQMLDRKAPGQRGDSRLRIMSTTSSERPLKSEGVPPPPQFSEPPPSAASGRSASGVRPARTQSGVRRVSVCRMSNSPCPSFCSWMHERQRQAGVLV